MGNKIKAGEPFPEIKVFALTGNELNLATIDKSFDWKMVVVYRGRHCPLCTRYLQQLDHSKDDFHNLGIELIAVSADSLDQLQEHQTRMQVGVPLAYGLSVSQMQQLGLYISEPRSEKETDHLFAEPGLFVINSNGNIQLVDISNGPFARPELATLLSGLKFIRDPANNYPIRGTFRYEANN